MRGACVRVHGRAVFRISGVARARTPGWLTVEHYYRHHHTITHHHHHNNNNNNSNNSNNSNHNNINIINNNNKAKGYACTRTAASLARSLQSHSWCAASLSSK